MEAALTTFPQQPTPAPAAPAPQTGFQGVAGPPDPDLIYSDKAAYQRQLEAWADNRTSQMLMQGASPMFAQQATTARFMSQMDPKWKPIWDKYGVEIDSQIAHVPAHQRTKDLYDLAAKTIKGEHADEIAQELAQRIAAERSNEGLERPGTFGGTAPASGDAIDTLFAENSPAVAHFKAAGLKASDVREHYRKMAIPPEKAAEMIRKSQALSTDRPLAASNR